MFGKVILLIAVLMMAVSTTLAQPTATDFGVNDASGNQNTFFEVPVNITNVQNAPVAGILFFISFDSNIINLTSERVKKGDLTSAWDAPLFNPVNGGIVIVFNGTGTEIPVGSSGSVIILNFSVIGAPGAKSVMNISRIQLSDPDGNVGTAPAKNGTFTIQPASGATVSIGSNSSSPGGTAIVPLMITGVTGVGGAEINITFDPAVVDIVNTTGGDFDLPPQDPPSNRGNNFVIIQVGQINTGLSGTVKVADITLKATGVSGQSTLTIQSAILSDINQNNIPVDTIINGTFTIIGGQGAPAITSWGNNNTNDASLGITVNKAETMRFNATANQTITHWRWFMDDSEIINNFDNFVNQFNIAGSHTVKVSASNSNGISNTVTWSINVQAPPGLTGSISGYKINDTNGNGKWDAGEKGISNWTIRLKGITGKGKNTNVVKKETLTDATGFYRFDDLPEGRYTVIEKLKQGFVPTSSPVKHIKLARGKISMNNNFTNRPVHSSDKENDSDIDDYEAINRDLDKYKEDMNRD